MPRTLPEAVKTYLDARIPVVSLDPTQSVVPPSVVLTLAAQACVGIVEVGGDNCGPMVEAFQSAAGTPTRQAWCLDFVQALIAYTEEVRGLKSPLPASQGVVNFWRTSPDFCRVISPEPGDLVLWEMGESGLGHCGFYVGPVTGQENFMKTIEGNTGPSGTIEREGDGVYAKTRLRKGAGSFKLLGFLRAFPDLSNAPKAV